MSKALPTIRITGYSGDTELFQHSFKRDVINIGKLARAQIRLEDSNVSRMHAVIEVTREGHVEIADLNSTNGTFVNEEKVSRSRLRSGDQVRIGDIRLQIDIITVSAVGAARKSRKREKKATVLPPSFNPTQYLDLKASEPELGSTACIEVIQVWRGTIQSALHLPLEKARVEVSSTPGATFVVDPDTLNGDDPLVLVEPSGGTASLNLAPVLQGSIRIADETKDVVSTRELHGGTIELSEKVRCALTLGEMHFLVSLQHIPAKPRTSFYQKLDLKDQSYSALSLALHLLFLLLLSLVPEEELIADRDHALNRDMLIQSIQVAEMERLEEEELEEEDEVVEEKQDIKVEKVVRKKQTQVVKKTVTKVDRVTKDKMENLTPEERTKRNKEMAENSGILKALNDDSLSLLDEPMEDMLDAGQLSGVIIASADPNAPTTTSFQAFSGQEGAMGGGGANDFMLPQGSVGTGGPGTKGMVSGLDKSAMAKDTSVGAGSLKKKKQKIKVDILAPQVSPGYDKEAVRRVIRSKMGAIRWCYQQALQRNPKLGGKVVLGFMITPTGRVQAPKVKDDSMQDPAVGKCIAKKSRNWKFPPPPDSGVVTVSYPFLFKAKQ